MEVRGIVGWMLGGGRCADKNGILLGAWGTLAVTMINMRRMSAGAFKKLQGFPIYNNESRC